jgi:hypothetical protein
MAQDFLPELVRRIKPSAVAIETFDAKGATISRGSGFFIANDKIITNRHVIEKSSRVEIHLIDGKKFTARGVLAIDGEGDLALLQVDVPQTSAAPLPLTHSAPQEGESIVVVGNPFGLEGSVSNGIVSAVREISGYGKIIQITAPISPGSSGSPVVNMRGQVIGVATLQAAEGQSLNFAVPSARITQLKIGDLQTFSSLNAETQKNKRAAAQALYSQGLGILSRDDFAKALPFSKKRWKLIRTMPKAGIKPDFVTECSVATPMRSRLRVRLLVFDPNGRKLSSTSALRALRSDNIKMRLKPIVKRQRLTVKMQTRNMRSA